MARLVLEHVHYDGSKYEYKSPKLPSGIVILEGANGTGKSTFSDLIYFGFGGNVQKFKKDARAKHPEIASDTDNYIELSILIDEKRFKLKRMFGHNDIAIFDEKEMIGVFPTFRSKDTRQTFSDWMLEKLGIEGFTLYFSRYKGKVSFSDLLRLMYHDQTQDVDKIYKQHDNTDNFVSDSEVFRKAIFEILVGKSFVEYYSALDVLKQLERNITDIRASIDAYAKAIEKIGNKDDWNSVRIRQEILEIEGQLNKLTSLRESLRSKGSVGDTDSVLVDFRKQMETIQFDQSETQEQLNSLVSELNSLQDLRRDLIMEVTQIKKIIFTHEQLSLFSPDTCPYCLGQVNRAKGKCICGCEIDESQYERFFYNSAEYVEILKSKQRNVETVQKGIASCELTISGLREKLTTLKSKNTNLQTSISKVVSNKTLPTDFSKLDEIDDKILELKSKKDSYDKQLTLEDARQQLENKLNGLEIQKSTQEALVDKWEADSRQKMVDTLASFNAKYNVLLQDTIANCRRARIDDSYMPIINDGDYVEASAVVPKRLMYYLTLLHLSLEDESINFPRFLLIDTPDTAGIDDENLKKAISKIPEVIGEDDYEKCQVVLTTGIKMYPDSLKDFVFQTLQKGDHLLQLKDPAIAAL